MQLGLHQVRVETGHVAFWHARLCLGEKEHVLGFSDSEEGGFLIETDCEYAVVDGLSVLHSRRTRVDGARPLDSARELEQHALLADVLLLRLFF